MKFFLLFIPLLFLSCSTKINPLEYHKIYAPKSKYLPNQNKIYSRPKVLIFDIKTNNFLLPYLKEYIENLLSNTSAIILTRKKTSLKEEIILSQESKLTNSNINSADYLIFAEITSTTYNYTYHKGYYFKDKKGKLHYFPPYYSYTACVSGNIKVLKIPQNYIAKVFSFSNCSYYTSRYYQNVKKELLLDALKEALNSLKNEFKNFFSKKGYVLEVRKKDNEIIIKTTLGSEDGLEEGDFVNIYTIKEYINPLTNKITKELVKIAEGEVSNVINPQSSWIIINSQKEQIKIGDIVKVEYEDSFFKRLFK